MSKTNSKLAIRFSRQFVKLRRGFFKLTMREKALILLFVFALLAVWFSWQMERQRTLSAQHDTVRRVEIEQQLEINDGPGVREAYNLQISEIDLNSLPTKDEASAQIDALARRSGFSNFDLGQPRTVQGADLRFHTFQLRIDKATAERIRSFTDMVKTELPYVSLERVVLQAQNRDDQFLDASFVFKSIEYIK